MKLKDILESLALVIALAEPGGAAAMSPIDSLLNELADWCISSHLPEIFTEAAHQAIYWLDSVPGGSVESDHDTLQKLTSWHDWMRGAVNRFEKGQPLEEPPPPWNVSGKKAAASRPILLDRTAGCLAAREPEIVLNLVSDADLLLDFTGESLEHLQTVERAALALEENPADGAILNSVFRAFHTFKGSAGILHLPAIRDLAHELESLLDAARQHKLKIDSEIISLILEGGDVLRRFVSEIGFQLAGQRPSQPICVPTLDLITRVKSVSANRSVAAPSAKLTAVLPGSRAGQADHQTPRAEPVTPSPARQEFREPNTVPGPKSAAKVPSSTCPNENHTAEGSDRAVAGTPASITPGHVRVDTFKLDSLLDLVGELAIAESLVMQDPDLRNLPSPQLAANLSQLARISGELQRTATSLRMVPIRATFQKMARAVREISARQHKQAQLVSSGEETELDRNMVEELNDPLVHMIRNALDHGIESPEVRKARGKPEMGTIFLHATHRGGNIVITVRDDGNGLDKERILAKAREKGLLQEDEAPSENDIFELIFAPGFSTAESVSDISGRGVGMDVVRNNIEKLRGAVDIASAPGKGATFTIQLPLTLAIIDGMIVGVGGERYIIPTFSVRESFRPEPGMISTLHERGEMVNVRGKLNPLLRLYEYFNLPGQAKDPMQSIVVVVESGQQSRCLLVDELLGKQEVVTKSLGEPLAKSRAIAGTAVLGDGRVGLILDVDSLVRLKNGAGRGGSIAWTPGQAVCGPAMAN